MSILKSILTSEHNEKVINAALPVILDFSAQWCSPCKRLSPILEELAAEWSGKATIYTVDSDSNSELVSLYRIMNLPTLILIKNGREAQRLIGLQTKAELQSEFEPHF